MLKTSSPLGVSSTKSCRSSHNGSSSASSQLLLRHILGLNSLPWIRAKIKVLFSRLHRSTAFPTILLSMRVTPFLLRATPLEEMEY